MLNEYIYNRQEWLDKAMAVFLQYIRLSICLFCLSVFLLILFKKLHKLGLQIILSNIIITLIKCLIKNNFTNIPAYKTIAFLPYLLLRPSQKFKLNYLLLYLTKSKPCNLKTRIKCCL